MNIEKFEGPEKKLDIILFSPRSDLRSNRDGKWQKVVNSSGSRILSSISTDDLDAYLLSESSLFVWNNRILMITCGKTSLINALPEILDLVDRTRVAIVFYERKKSNFPQEQPFSFKDEANRLTRLFPGKSYRLGSANYDHVHVFFWAHPDAKPEKNMTLQLLMHDLDPSFMASFCTDGKRAMDLDMEFFAFEKFFPLTERDSHFFSPYGYSLNGLSKSNYLTVHITPQSNGSYASFETNIIQDDYTPLIKEIICMVKPEKFSLILSTHMERDTPRFHATFTDGMVNHWITEKSQYDFDCGYRVTFLSDLDALDLRHSSKADLRPQLLQR